jgi:hypothetical protein
VSHRCGIVAAALAGVGIAAACAAALVAPAGGDGAVAATVTLQVAPRGLGTVSANPPGRDSDNEPVTTCTRNVAQRACEWRFERGTTVTLTAQPDATTGRAFSSWSRPECGATPVCTLVVDDDSSSIVALFTPLRLAIRVSDPSAGVVTTDPAGAQCRQQLKDPSPTLCREFAPGTRVTVTVTPTPPHSLRMFSPGCLPVGATSCAITVLDEATWVGAALDDDRLPVLPTTITVQFRLVKSGDGRGRVDADNLDCGSRCESRYSYGAPLTLRASPEPGSVFAGWSSGGTHVCPAGQSTCTVLAGPDTAIVVRFDRAGPRPPSGLRVTARTRKTVTVSWSSQPGAPPVTRYQVFVNGALRATTATRAHRVGRLGCARRFTIGVAAVDERGRRSSKAVTAARTAPCLTARVAAVRVESSPTTRTIVARIDASRKAVVRLSLLAGRRVAAQWRSTLGPGPRTLRLAVPNRLSGGSYRLRISFAVAEGVQAAPDRVVRLPGR